jgi:hypothetical protein
MPLPLTAVVTLSLRTRARNESPSATPAVLTCTATVKLSPFSSVSGQAPVHSHAVVAAFHTRSPTGASVPAS